MSKKAKKQADFHFENHGTILLCQPMNDAAREHLTENTAEDAMWFAGALAVEPRYARDLASGLISEGFACD